MAGTIATFGLDAKRNYKRGTMRPECPNEQLHDGALLFRRAAGRFKILQRAINVEVIPEQIDQAGSIVLALGDATEPAIDPVIVPKQQALAVRLCEDTCDVQHVHALYATRVDKSERGSFREP